MSSVPGSLDFTSAEAVSPQPASARLASVGVAVPVERYSQEDVLNWFGESNPKIRKLFHNSHIDERALYLPPRVDGCAVEESNQELIEKHLRGVLELGPQAITDALEPLGLEPTDLDFIVCVTSTGFLCPGISARIIQHMGLRNDIQRLDVVGMGCNAAMNAMQMAIHTANRRPGSVGVLLCAEICSAAYVMNESMGTAVVNSLFGDGVAAAVIRADDGDGAAQGPSVVDFESLIHTETIESMKYTLDGSKLSFFLDKEIPWVIGENAHIPVGRLLARHSLRVEDIDHWIIHSGGKKVIDAISANLGLTEHDVRHTRGVLRDHGNVSSGSVLFSFERLRREAVAEAGDVGVMIAMGPGMSIEAALLRW
jgi:polyketide synthase Type III